MNIVDYVILGVIGVSVLFGLFRGFVASVMNTGGCLLAFGGSFILFPRLADAVRNNEELVTAILHYTDASSRLGDLEMAVRNAATLASDTIADIVTKANLPEPLNTLLTVNLENQVFAGSGTNTVSEYVSQTILNACINVLCFLVCFLALYLVLTLAVAVIRAVFSLPMLKQLDSLAGGAFGLLRGMIFCYALFAVVPLVLTVVPVDAVSELFDQSTLAPMFNASNLILSVMNGRL